jgi:hypothetical protein
MRFGLFLCVLLLATFSEARIGETAIQFVNRYGAPRDTPSSKTIDKNSPLVEGAIHHTYEYQGWKIRAAFLKSDGPAIRMDFQKMSGAANGISIQDCELEAIKMVNTPLGMNWSPMVYDNPVSPDTGPAKSGESFIAVGHKIWRRTDGAIISLRSNLTVRLELPVARRHEERLKIRKNQKTHASVSQF